MAGRQEQYEVEIWIDGPGRFKVATDIEPESEEWYDQVVTPLVNRFLRVGWETGHTTGGATELVQCSRCLEHVPAAMAHELAGEWIGDDCCWGDVLRGDDE